MVTYFVDILVFFIVYVMVDQSTHRASIKIRSSSVSIVTRQPRSRHAIADGAPDVSVFTAFIPPLKFAKNSYKMITFINFLGGTAAGA